jgi:hypothetical protein
MTQLMEYRPSVKEGAQDRLMGRGDSEAGEGLGNLRTVEEYRNIWQAEFDRARASGESEHLARFFANQHLTRQRAEDMHDPSSHEQDYESYF